jgi:hypothetical protein
MPQMQLRRTDKVVGINRKRMGQSPSKEFFNQGSLSKTKDENEKPKLARDQKIPNENAQ